MMFNNSDRT